MNESRKTALVTGASGNIAGVLINKLLARDFRVITLTSSEKITSDPKVIHIHHIWGSPIPKITQPIDVTFHLSCNTSAYLARNTPNEYMDQELNTTLDLLSMLRRNSTNSIFVLAGSMTEYGLNSTEIISEKDIISPTTFYDIAKSTSHFLARQFELEKWIRKAITLRLPNVYGAINATYNKQRGFIDNSIVSALSGKDLKYFGTGNYLRDFIHIDDTANAFMYAYLNADKLEQSAFNIGTGVGTSIKDALEIIAKSAALISNSKCQVYSAEFTKESYEIEKRSGVADSSKFREFTEWIPKIGFSEGIQMSMRKILTLGP
jgi:nucleoside-diphosphate-sugar epimerase